MVLGARTLTDWGEVLVLQSADKLHWNHINTLTTPEPFGYMWECPDLFCLDGRWYLLVSPQGIPCQNVYGCGYFALEGDWRTKDCTLGQFYPLDSGFDFTPPRPLQTSRTAAASCWDGWGCRMPPMATKPPWTAAGSTA